MCFDGLLKHSLDAGLFGRTQIDTGGNIAFFDTGNRRFRNQIAIKLNGAGRIIIARYWIINTVRVAIAVQNGNHRNTQCLGLGNCN